MNPARKFFALAAVVLASTAATPPADAGTPATATRVDRSAVVARVIAGSPSTRSLRAMTKVARVRALGRCVPIAELTYCLGFGWGSAPSYAAAARVGRSTRPTGDLSLADWIRRRTQMTNAQRRAAEIHEIDLALAGLDKARRIQRIATGAGSMRTTALANAAAIMNGYQTRQIKSWYCGPATLQSIDWADDGSKNDQDALAENHLGTTAEGTSIYRMVEAINDITAWDNKAGGPYQVQSVADWTASSFYAVHRAQLGDETPAPIVEHPQLLSKYFRYLNFNHSGHYQVGRGFQLSNGVPQIHIFEVFNENDFNSAGATTWGPQTVDAILLLKATKANTTHQNIGL